MKGPGIVVLALLMGVAMPRASSAQTWTPLNNQPNFGIGAGTALLLTDGSILMHDEGNGGESDWARLTPDAFGSYVNGTWTSSSNLPPGYGPLYFASAVLPDGRVVVLGGEYNLNDAVGDTNKGAIYTPSTNSWASLAGPGWAQIGDASCCMLPDGTFLLANQFGSNLAVMDPTTLTWTPVGSGKADDNSEEGWALLPDGTIVTVDCQNGTQAEKYDIKSKQWISAGDVGVILPNDGGQPIVAEMGPSILRPDGTVLEIGASGHNAVYTPPANPTDPGTWAAAPDFPNIGGQLDVADGPACLLPNGNVLVGASPGVFNPPLTFFEIGPNSGGNKMLQVPGTPDSPGLSSYQGRMLLLPTGQALYTDGSNDVEIYTPTGAPNAAWRPTIKTCPLVIQPGGTYTLTGTQLNGLSQAVAYGDDATNATNYPLVRITNHVTGHVFYCTTHNFTPGVATGNATVSTMFDVPANLEPGISDVTVVANGIASAPFLLGAQQVAPASVTVNPTRVVQFTPSTGTVVLTTKTVNLPAPVFLSSSNPAVAQVPGEVDVPANAISANFTITTGAVASATPVIITATSAGVSVTTTLTVGPPPPNPPVNLVAIALGPDRVLLNWVNGGGKPTQFYTVQRQTGLGAWTSVGNQIPVGTTQILDNGLASSTLYRYRVLANNDGGASAPSQIATVTTAAVAPGSPSGLTATAVSTSEIDLTWVPYNSDPSVKFVVERRLAGGGYPSPAPAPISATSLKDTGLASGTTYFYRVHAVNAVGVSGYTSEVSAKTQSVALPPPVPPTGLTGSGAGTQINLSWTDNAGDFTSFKVERKTVGGSYSQINLVPVTTTSYADPTAIPNTHYVYRVRATNAAGDSGYSNEFAATLSTDLILGSVSVASVGQPGITLQLLNSSNAVVSSTSTDASGSFSFRNLADGVWTVKAIVPGAQSQSQTVTLTASGSSPGVATVNFNVASIYSFSKGLSLASSPYDYSNSPFTALDVFGLPAPGGNGTAPVSTFDATSNSYHIYPNLPGVKTLPGRGYWVTEATAKSFHALGAPITAATFDVPLQPGWNLIGNPYPGAASWSAVHVKLPYQLGAAAAGTPISMGSAMAYRIINQPYSYTGTGSTIPSPPSLTGANPNYTVSTSVAPFVGYWVYVNPATARGQGIMLSFTNPSP